MLDADKVYHEMMDAGSDWADKESAASLLEAMEKPVLAKLKKESGEKTDGKRGDVAYSSEEYKELLEQANEARRVARKAYVRWVSVQDYSNNQRTAEATKRAEMQNLHLL